MTKRAFFNLYNHGFIRTALCIPSVRVADPLFNAEQTIDLANRAAGEGAMLALFPELGMSAYSNDDLFHQEALLKGVLTALGHVVNASKRIPSTILVVGAPLCVGNRLFNCGIVINGGLIVGVAVKSYLPNYREFYESRQFSPAEEGLISAISLCNQENVPFGNDLIFPATTLRNFSLYIEICEDLWVPIPPSSFAALAGATVIGNLSASNITVGKADYRHSLVSNQSARTISAYLYTAAGFGESTNDLAWDGHALIYENGTLKAESLRFSQEPQVIVADIDLDRLAQERMRMTSFGQNARHHRQALSRFRQINITAPIPKKKLLLAEGPARFPYVPADASLRDQRCCEIYNIQATSLAKRLLASQSDNAVIGVSGGLDSAQALIVAARTMDLLGRPRTGIKAYTMPGFATSDKTYRNALNLMEALGVETNEIDIRPSCLQMFHDIGHPYAQGNRQYDITFENIQAGERTSHLFRIANFRNGIVIGTGDLSELALGWCTYGVGDHMSHYNVNASIPKTLIQHLLRWIAQSGQFDEKTTDILLNILETEISPELVPGDSGADPMQKTEATVGPYELQDFAMFYITRYGYLPQKIAFMAYCAWRDKKSGFWPDIPLDRRNEYSLADIKHWISVFCHRFFKTSQFKRTCVPNGPKVGSGGSLSPRGDYRAPSDSEAVVWIENAENIPDEEA